MKRSKLPNLPPDVFSFLGVAADNCGRMLINHLTYTYYDYLMVLEEDFWQDVLSAALLNSAILSNEVKRSKR